MQKNPARRESGGVFASPAVVAGMDCRFLFGDVEFDQFYTDALVRLGFEDHANTVLEVEGDPGKTQRVKPRTASFYQGCTHQF